MHYLSYRRAFTLVELSVGLGLGLLVLYLAAAAVSNVNQTIALSKELSRENNLLRRGIKAAFTDTDFWHSHADPRPPFSKDFLHHEPASQTRREAKRPMSKLTFRKSMNPRNDHGAGNNDIINATPGGTGRDSYGVLLNPNALMAHDPRSWYRGFHQTPRGRVLLKNSGSRSGDAITRRYQLAVPQGMDIRHFYAADILTATNMTQTGKYFSAGTNAAERPGGNIHKWHIQSQNPSQLLDNIDPAYITNVNQYLMNTAFRIYQRLNIIGSVEYLPKGTPLMLHDETGRTPWFRSSPSYDANATIQNYPDANFQYGFNAVSVGRDGLNMNKHYQYGRSDSGSYRVSFGIKFTDAANMYRLHGLTNTIAYAAKPVENSEYRAGIFEGLKWNRLDSGTRSFDNVSQWVVIHRNRWNSGYLTEIDSTDARAWRSHTIRLPQNTSDHIRKNKNNYYDWTDRPANFPSLETTILRYQQYLGGNLTINQVWVNAPDTGKRTKIKFSVTGTNFRGARQHWGVVGDSLGYDMGDHYE